MYTTILLLSVYLSCFHCTENLPLNGYYVGRGDFLLLTYVKIEGNRAIADFIAWDHFPRSLESDTLAFDSTRNVWMGRKTTIYQKGKHLRIQTIKDSLVLGTIINTKLKSNEKYYLETANLYRNTAMLNELFSTYMRANKENPNARQIFESVRIVYEPSIYNTHSEFLRKFKRFKAELDLQTKKTDALQD